MCRTAVTDARPDDDAPIGVATVPLRSRLVQTRRRFAGGVTLLESLVASVILSATVSAVGLSVGVSHMQSAQVAEDARLALLGGQLMEEIVAKSFADPETQKASAGPNEAARSAYDDVGDYHGYSDSTAALTTAGGVAAGDGGAAYTRSVTVRFRARPGGPDSAGGDLALITVTVTAPDGRNVSASRLVSRFQPGRQD